MIHNADPFPGFKFGADPELFVVDGNGSPVCADGLIPGTKDEPYKVAKGALQVDGMAAEFNIDPAETFEEFDDNIASVLKTLKSYLPKGYSLLAAPAVVFSEEEWDRAPDHAKILGCSPDFNAWTGEANPPPNDPSNPRLRTASGHIHIGWNENLDPTDPTHVGHCQLLVKQLDYYLGAWSLQKDPDETRRRLYGKAGACRFKPYGVEYRVLSNFWVTNKPMRRMVWNRLQRALFDMAERYIPGKEHMTGYDSLLIKSIDDSQRIRILEQGYRYPICRL